MLIIMRSIERNMQLVGTAETADLARDVMQEDFSEVFWTEFHRKPTIENLDEYAEEARLDLTACTAYITGSQNYDWKVIKIAEPYFAQKRWSRDDIAGCLAERGYQGSDWEVDKVLQEKGLKHLEDCTDEDWETIHQAMDSAGFPEKEESDDEER